MTQCKLYAPLAYTATAYILSSLVYLLCSRFVGTPFANALQEYPSLLAIKKESAVTRKKIFFVALFLSIIVLYFWKPFQLC